MAATINSTSTINSCYECIIFHVCDESFPNMSKTQARKQAAVCDSIRKGRATDRISVSGFERGLSRKNAEKLVTKGKARWLAPYLIKLSGDLPENLRKKLLPKD